MTKVTIYHNPRCSKSRQTLELLRSQGIEPDIILYLETPPNKSTIKNLLNMLDLPVRDLIRNTEPEFRQQGLQDPSLPDDVLIDAIAATPKLLQRPIVVCNPLAAIGRPPEAVQTIL